MACSTQELYQKVYDVAALQHRDTALDIATGSGQAAAVLAQSFKRARLLLAWVREPCRCGRRAAACA